MQRSIKLLKSQGYTTAITEHFNMFAKIRIDLFNFVDILCLQKGKMLAVQTTTAKNILARKIKIEANPNYPLLKSTGCAVEVWGWSLKGKRGEKKTWGVKIVKL